MQVLKLMFGAMIRAAERCRAITVTGFERRPMEAMRRNLDQNCKLATVSAAGPYSMHIKTDLSGTF